MRGFLFGVKSDDSVQSTGSTSPRDWIDYSRGAESLATIVALGVGAWWALRTLRKTREHCPRADVVHHIQVVHLDEANLVVHAAALVKNIGVVPIVLTSAKLRLLRVLPLDDELRTRIARDPKEILGPAGKEVDWPGLGEHSWDWVSDVVRVEPGESHLIECDFVVARTLEQFQVYSYVGNPSLGNKIGWGHTTMHNLEELSAAQQHQGVSATSPQAEKKPFEKQAPAKPPARRPLPEQAPPKAPPRPPSNAPGKPGQLNG